MSEIPKLPHSKDEVDAAFWGMAAVYEADDAAEETPKNKDELLVASIAERVRTGELSNSLPELAELSRGISDEWQSEGFSRATSYLDAEGNLILLSLEDVEKQPPEPAPLHSSGEGEWEIEDDEEEMPKESKTWRMLVDNQVSTVTVPPEWQGDSFHWRSMHGTTSIYELPEDVSEEDLPEDMHRLVEKFGRKLDRSYNHKGGSLGADAVSLNEVMKEVDSAEQRKRDAEVDGAHEEALTIERVAKNYAEDQVVRMKKRGWFTTAKKYARLQEEERLDAHRHAVKHQIDRM